jgi:hypothetical protein
VNPKILTEIENKPKILPKINLDQKNESILRNNLETNNSLKIQNILESDNTVKNQNILEIPNIDLKITSNIDNENLLKRKNNDPNKNKIKKIKKNTFYDEKDEENINQIIEESDENKFVIESNLTPPNNSSLIILTPPNFKLQNDDSFDQKFNYSQNSTLSEFSDFLISNSQELNP